jgi:glycine oxidase
MHSDVIVVGGGVIGLATAWWLRRHHLTVTLLDAGMPGGQSSRAAAGILGPLAESPDDGPLTRLLWASLRRYPAWIDALREDAATDPELDWGGILTVTDAAGVDRLRASLAWRRQYDPAVTWRDPGPGDRWAGAVWSPHEGQLFGPAYLAALAEAVTARGVDWHRDEPAVRLWVENQGEELRCRGAETPRGRVAADWVVLAAGAWSSALWGPAEAVYPMRGQVMGLMAASRPFGYVLFGCGGYVVPKRNGLVVVGATEDRAGYASHVTLEGLRALIRRLEMLAPTLMTLPFEAAWAGLRPATADGLPMIGPATRPSHLIVATGHYRNGLLLSPITAEAVTDWVSGKAPETTVPWAAFSPDRLPPTAAV